MSQDWTEIVAVFREKRETGDDALRSAVSNASVRALFARIADAIRNDRVPLHRTAIAERQWRRVVPLYEAPAQLTRFMSQLRWINLGRELPVGASYLGELEF